MDNNYQDFPNPLKDIYEGIIEIKNMLKKMQIHEQESQNDDDQLLTIKDAAKMLCYSVPSMYRLIQAKEIPHFKKGSKLLFSKNELTIWLQQGRRKTVVEISEDAEKYLDKLGVKKNENDMLGDVDMSVRTGNILFFYINYPTKKFDITSRTTVKELSKMISKKILLSSYNCGKKAITEIEKILNERGLSLNSD